MRRSCGQEGELGHDGAPNCDKFVVGIDGCLNDRNS
jgi:hypothetical protein